MVGMPRRLLAFVTGVLCAAALVPGRAWAADGPHVAHLSFVEGDVAIVRAAAVGVGGAASLNAPVFESDSIVTGPSGRAEIALDPQTFVRLAPGSQVRVLALADAGRSLELDGGTLELHAFRDPPNVGVATATLSVAVEQAGRYRFSLGADRTTTVTVRAGRASVAMPRGGELALLPGTTLSAGGPPSSPTIAYAVALAPDDFDAW